MCLLIIYLLLPFQVQAQTPGNFEERRWMLEMQTRQMKEQLLMAKERKARAEAREAALREYFFVGKVNRLVKSLREFIDGYNGGKVDAKNVKEVQKAWRELEKADGWFKKAKESKEEHVAPSCQVQLASSKSK